jgi:hypothetical protein
MEFSNKLPGETEFVGFNFAPRLVNGGGAIQSATFVVTVLTGADQAPSALKIGTPLIQGFIVKQMVGGGVSGVMYRITATVVTTTGQTLIESASLRVG